MTPSEEAAYIEGKRSVWIRMLREAIRELGQEGSQHAWHIERAETVSKLREVCAEFGDNDWPDYLHLGDVIEKHLWRNLEEEGSADDDRRG